MTNHIHLLLTPVEEYPWSSYRTNTLGEIDELLTPDQIYKDLENTVEETKAIRFDKKSSSA